MCGLYEAHCVSKTALLFVAFAPEEFHCRAEAVGKCGWSQFSAESPPSRTYLENRMRCKLHIFVHLLAFSSFCFICSHLRAATCRQASSSQSEVEKQIGRRWHCLATWAPVKHKHQQSPGCPTCWWSSLPDPPTFRNILKHQKVKMWNSKCTKNNQESSVDTSLPLYLHLQHPVWGGRRD